jgi:[glutamine synthetase] adenylyltransferase / [glutamine synthetase]-adenylyl-L-tyrosine phosphorylase
MLSHASNDDAPIVSRFTLLANFMPDLARLQSALLDCFPESWVRHHLESFQTAYFEAFDAVEVARHLGMMPGLTDQKPVAVQARPAGPGAWWVDVVGYDCFQFLSTLCNLLAVRGFSIVEGRVFTSQPPPRAPERTTRRVSTWPARPPRPAAGGPDRRPKIVDVFRVEHQPGAPEPPNWDEFQAELNILTRLLRENQYEEVHHRLIGRLVAALERHPSTSEEALEPIELAIDPKAANHATMVQIGARDSFGFLYLTTSALALCGIRIVQADIRTRAGRVDDVLWVTDRFGRKIVEEPKIRELRLSLILIEHFSSRLPQATNPESALLHFSRFATETMARPNWPGQFEALDRPQALDALARVLGESDFLWEDYLHAQPENLLPMICNPSEWTHRRSPEELAAELEAALEVSPNLDAKCRALGRFKDREIFRADIRSILGMHAGIESFSSELSDVAEVLMWAAYRAALAELGPHFPLLSDGRPAPSALLALGKFGGRELGFASDLELMLVYADQPIAPAPAVRSAAEYFDRLVAVLRNLLPTCRGGTFELDFRLRPYGRGGTPATALTAFRNYYRPGGSAWCYERQALIKLRAVAGDLDFGRQVEALRDQFVYGPEPFDVEGFRRMRRLQVEQLVQPGTFNAKYSPGALVDIEYFVQALQIAHGSRHPSLRTPNTLQAIHALGAAGILQAAEAETLRECYRFFRRLINALRVAHGHAKELSLPAAGTDELSLLARRMHLPDEGSLDAKLQECLSATRSLACRLEALLGVQSA